MSNTFPERTYGVEIEVAGISEEQAYLVLRLAGVKVNDPLGSRHADPARWRIHSDGSIEDNRNASDVAKRTCEVVSPILNGTDGLKQIRKVCSVLKKAGAYVNDSCGLHVHVGATDLAPQDVLTIVKRYHKYESQICKFFHPSRNDNEFCMPMDGVIQVIDDNEVIANLNNKLASENEHLEHLKTEAKNCDGCRRIAPRLQSENEHWCSHHRYCIAQTNSRIRHFTQAIEHYTPRKFDRIEDITRLIDGRYYRVNVDAYNRHKTIEFRHHHGSLSANEITAWVQFVLAFVETSRGLTLYLEVPFKNEPNDTPMTEARQMVYHGLRLAGADGLSAETIISLTQSSNYKWTVVDANITRMIEQNGLQIETFVTNGIKRWRLKQPPAIVNRPKFLKKDLGLNMNIPKHVRKHFSARSTKNTKHTDILAAQ